MDEIEGTEIQRAWFRAVVEGIELGMRKDQRAKSRGLDVSSLQSDQDSDVGFSA